MEMFIEVLKAVLIGVVEGITEWLPISSTGHMILVDEFVQLNVSDTFLALFLVVIQLGAIMAVVILYFHKLNPFAPSKTKAERLGTWRLWGMVVVGCIPAGIVGLSLEEFFSEHFFNAWTVAAALIVYGVIFIVLERRNRKRLAQAAELAEGDFDEDDLFRVRTVDDIDWKMALKIGCFQTLAILPGTSRSGSIIIGGMLLGCSRTAAAEFAFFLAIPVMFGWGFVKVVKYILEFGFVVTSIEIAVLVTGIITAFVVSVLSIKFLMGYIKKNDFTAFGWYRIAVGLVVLAYFGAKAFGLF